MRKPKTAPLPERQLQKAIESVAPSIQEPGSKLRFIQRTLEVYEKQPGFLRKATLLKPVAARLACFEALEELSAERRLGPVLALPQPSWTLYRARHVVLVLLLAGSDTLATRSGRPATGRPTKVWISSCKCGRPSPPPRQAGADHVATRRRPFIRRRGWDRLP